jgi:hypothetical protein
LQNILEASGGGSQQTNQSKEARVLKKHKQRTYNDSIGKQWSFARSKPAKPRKRQ